MAAVLELKDLWKSFDGLLAVQNANLVVVGSENSIHLIRDRRRIRT